MTHPVEELFATYEAALMADDLDTLRDLFWPDATRYGTDGNQRSGNEIDAARRRPHEVRPRTLDRTMIRSVGDEVAIAETEFERDGRHGRQSQVWVRRDGRWGILHAHVSMHP